MLDNKWWLTHHSSWNPKTYTAPCPRAGKDKQEVKEALELKTQRTENGVIPHQFGFVMAERHHYWVPQVADVSVIDAGRHYIRVQRPAAPSCTGGVLVGIR